MILFKAFIHSLSHWITPSFIHSFAHKTLGNKNAICLKRAQYLPSTAHYRGTDSWTDTRTDGHEHSATHTHSAGHTNRAIEIASKFHNCKVFSSKMPTAFFSLDIFITDSVARESAERRRARRPQVCIVRTLPPPSLSPSLAAPACTAIAHTPRWTRQLRLRLGLRFIVAPAAAAAAAFVFDLATK